MSQVFVNETKSAMGEYLIKKNRDYMEQTCSSTNLRQFQHHPVANRDKIIRVKRFRFLEARAILPLAIDDRKSNMMRLTGEDVSPKAFYDFITNGSQVLDDLFTANEQL